MVGIEQIRIGLSNYIDNEILMKAPPLKQFMYGFVKGAMIDKLDNIVMQYKDNDMMNMIGLISDKGIDIENAYKWAKQSMKQSGQIVLMGIIFNENDIDKLYHYIQQAHA